MGPDVLGFHALGLTWKRKRPRSTERGIPASSGRRKKTERRMRR